MKEKAQNNQDEINEYKKYTDPFAAERCPYCHCIELKFELKKIPSRGWTTAFFVLLIITILFTLPLIRFFWIEFDLPKFLIHLGISLGLVIFTCFSFYKMHKYKKERCHAITCMRCNKKWYMRKL